MYKIARSLLFRMDAERAHHLVLDQLSKRPTLMRLAVPSWTPALSLEQDVLGMRFPHPVGLAAGLDKNAVAIPGLFACGFSSIEVGTVTPVPQPGNPVPRLYRLKADEALINRMGFNNDGCAACADQIDQLRHRPGVIGVNIGKNKMTPNETAAKDYEQALQAVLPVADYITINLSSPNTPGLRDLQSASGILQILERMQPILAEQPKPVFVKLSPDSSDQALIHIAQTLAESTFAHHIGIIATNTTVARDSLQSSARYETGGLSGKPLANRATAVIRTIWRATEGTIPIVGCGGIFDADDAYEKIRAGASLLQIYTAFIYRGPGVVRDIVKGLEKRITADGYQTVQEAVGVDAG